MTWRITPTLRLDPEESSIYISFKKASFPPPLLLASAKIMMLLVASTAFYGFACSAGEMFNRNP
jgi:hypothetical protein